MRSKSKADKQTAHQLVGCFNLFGFCHIAFNVESCHLNGSVGSYRDGFLKMTWEFTRAVVCHFEFSLFSWFDGSLRVFGDRTSTAGNSLIDD